MGGFIPESGAIFTEGDLAVLREFGVRLPPVEPLSDRVIAFLNLVWAGQTAQVRHAGHNLDVDVSADNIPPELMQAVLELTEAYCRPILRRDSWHPGE